MADTNSQQTQTQTTGTAVTGDGVVVDKNKSQEQYIKEAEAKYIIPALVRDKFPDLVKLIYETESMNTEEREYWMQILPIMSEEQIVKFREILVNEKQQLAKLDNEYENEVARINKSQPAEIDEVKMREEMEKIKKAETTHEEQEKSQEEELLKRLKDL